MSFQAGFVGLIGLPNAGKSTLLNALVGQKVGAVTQKPQTTRKRLIGISTLQEGQVLWVDTPGWIEKNLGLNKFLEQEFKKALQDCDAFTLVLNLDASNMEKLETLVGLVVATGKPFHVVISKTDLSELYHRRVKLEEYLRSKKISYSTWNKNEKESLVELKETVMKMLPESPGALYPDDYFTLQTEKELVSEWVLESCFEQLHEEIPYGMAVQVRRFHDPKKEDDAKRVYVDLIVSKPNHLPMVVGQQGQTLKRIGQTARMMMEKNFDHKVYLELFVKVRKNWMKESGWMKEYGYELDPS